MDFATGNDFGIAVSKFLGLDPFKVTNTQLNSGINAPLTLTIEHVVSRLDLADIAALMEPLSDETPAVPDHPLRDEYDSMMPHQQAHFGSFDAYVAMHEKLDAPEPELQVKWIAGYELTPTQINAAMGEHDGKYAINVDDLDDRQKALP